MSSCQKKNQCTTCLGTGFVRIEKKMCAMCDEIGCNNCFYSGYTKQPPFKECASCFSSGEIDADAIDKLKKETNHE